VRNIAEVTNAVAKGDPRASHCRVKGEILAMKKTPINTMVDQLNGLPLEVNPRGPRVRQPMAKLGGQAGAGAWPAPGRISPTNRNSMASNPYRTSSQHCDVAGQLSRAANWPQDQRSSMSKRDSAAQRECQHDVDQRLYLLGGHPRC